MATNSEVKILGMEGTEQLVAKVKDIFSDKVDKNEIPSVINTALAQAKASGEFDGKDGADGKTPVRGTDYWTETDKNEIKSYVDNAILGGAW